MCLEIKKKHTLDIGLIRVHEYFKVLNTDLKSVEKCFFGHLSELSDMHRKCVVRVLDIDAY
jgi:hypothetical protein